MSDNNTELCDVCFIPGCDGSRHEGRRFDSKKCDYTGTAPFADAEWANDPDAMCLWCAGTGHPYGDESYGMCDCPAVNRVLCRLQ